jgi:hypothetical protein
MNDSAFVYQPESRPRQLGYRCGFRLQWDHPVVSGAA